jgi:putative sugar O-methyltransferase
MNILDRAKSKYVRIKHEYRNINNHDIDNGKLKILQDEIRVINKSVPLGTSSWENNRREIRRAILEDNISDFINWDVIQKTMFFVAPKVEYLEVMKNQNLAKAIKESTLGNPMPYFLDSSTSGNLIHHAYSIAQLFKVCDLTEFDNVIEFGGGYGSMCRLFKNMNYQGEYTIFDLPEFSALQKFYLSSINEDYIKNVVFTGDMGLLNNKINSLFIATWSFSEMPIDLREKLLKNLNFNYCVIAFQSEFDGINNIEYFENFKSRYENIDFSVYQIEHLNGHFYLIGTKK